MNSKVKNQDKVKKSKRIKRVFSSSFDVFHLWANQSQSDARQGGRITRAFFQGTSCFSYGWHYEVGRLVKINGRQVALINTDSPSRTTSKHTGEAKAAASHLVQIYVDGSFDWKQGLLNTQGKLIDDLMSALNATKFWGIECAYSEHLREEIENFNKTCVAVGMPHLKLVPDQELLDVLREHVQYRIKRTEALKDPIHDAKRELARQRRLEAEERKAQKQVEDWLRGEGQRTSAMAQIRPALIRVNGNEVETSMGAHVPLHDALKLLARVEHGSAVEGERVGSYSFTMCEGDTVRIGCHEISLEHARDVLSQYQFKLVQGGSK